MLWLIRFLREQAGQTMIIVSHDRFFINEVTEEIVMLRDQQLTYFTGTLAQLQKARQEKNKMKQTQLEAFERKKEHVQRSIQKGLQQSKGDDKKLGMVASRKKVRV